MTDLAAFSGTYADWKLIKTRSVVQVVFEIPVENSNAVLQVLGGMPDGTRWFGIAPINLSPPVEKEKIATPRPTHIPKSPAGAKRAFRDLPPAQQAGIHCEDPMFAAFLREARPDDWHEAQDAAECVRLICAVSTRADLSTNHKARVIWHQLDSQFQAWKAMEHA